MIYENFVMRLHRDAAATDWEISVSANSAGALSSFVLGDVQIPHPTPKASGEDVPGTNGTYDMTEAAGRVFYENRPIVVPLVMRADREWSSTIDSTLAHYNGRLCDFAFAQYDEVEWIYTGRLSITKDRFANAPVVLTFDAWPFAREADYTVLDVPVSASLDKDDFGWTFSRAIAGSLTAVNNSAGVFSISASEIGSILEYARSGLTPGDHYTLGIRSIVGGSIAFHSAADGDNLTEGIVDENGVLTVRITVDGSYYDWQTVDNVVFSYPAFRCEYILAKMPTGAYTFLPSNSLVRPEIANASAKAILIMDGAVFDIEDTNTRILQPTGAVLPGVRADKSGATAKCIFVCVPKTTGTPEMTIGFYEQEAF